MLRTRILTALILIPLVLWTLFAALPLVWAVGTFAIMLLGAWEWSRLSTLGPGGRAGFVAVVAAAAFGLYITQSVGIVAALVVVAVLGFWLLLVPLWLGRLAQLRQAAVMLPAALMALLPAWLAMLTLRMLSPTLLLSVMGLVWVADSAAYFAGKAFGRHKLAPAISPGKTWEGAAGGLIAVLLYAWGVHEAGWLAPLPLSLGLTLLLAALLTPLSIAGDLFESWMKRCAGVKDSSHLLPGHGGILDRIDALIAVLGVTMAILLLWRGL